MIPTYREPQNIYVTSLEAFALMQTLNAEILASRSATLVLEKWCRGPVVAERIENAAKALSPELKRHLHLEAGEEMKYRRVRLRCGSRVLSEADNWYVPGRLTAEMNRLLETTGTPFGKTVQPLEPYRRTLAMRLLWSPFAGCPLAIPDSLFEHRAVLYTRDHLPFSLVNETYTRQSIMPRRQPARECVSAGPALGAGSAPWSPNPGTYR